MKPRSAILALYACFLTFSLLSIFFGATGISSVEKLNDRKRAVSANLEKLDERQEDLKTILSDLRSNPEAVMVEARSLGLFRPEDNVAYMNGPEQMKIRYDAGSVLRLQPLEKEEESFLRIASLAVGILALLVSLVSRRSRSAATERR